MRPQVVAEGLALRDREGEGGRLALWARSSVWHGVGPDPCRQSPSPREKESNKPLVQGWSLICKVGTKLRARPDSGLGTGELSLPHGTSRSPASLFAP